MDNGWFKLGQIRVGSDWLVGNLKIGQVREESGWLVENWTG